MNVSIFFPQPLTNAEKQRRFREKRNQDEAKRKEYLLYQKNRYKNEKESGKRKLVADMSDREHRASKKKWRLDKREQREKAKTASMSAPEKLSQYTISRQKKYIFDKALTDRELLKKENDDLKCQLANERRKSDMKRKKLTRLNITPKASFLTPSSKAKKILSDTKKGGGIKKVQRQLTFHYALMEELKMNIRKKIKNKTISLKSIQAGKVLKKYRLKSEFCKAVHVNPPKVEKKKKSKYSQWVNEVREFYLRPDNSIIQNGQKNTITINKIKKQKYLLKDTIENLFKKFVSESNFTMSFTTFWRMKPFWVRQPKESDRLTCQCKTCENAQFLADALFKNEVIKSSSIQEIIRDACCNQTSKDCMYGVCKKCNTKTIPLNISSKDQSEHVSWKQWETRKEKRTLLSGIEKEVSITEKRDKSGNIDECIDLFNEMIWIIKKHYYNIHMQSTFLKKVKTDLKENEAMIHVDFAQNYVCKLSTEIQSTHYGASKKQIVLHTGYYAVRQNKKKHSSIILWRLR